MMGPIPLISPQRKAECQSGPRVPSLPQTDLGVGSGDKASPFLWRLGPVQPGGNTAGQQLLDSVTPHCGPKLHIAMPGQQLYQLLLLCAGDSRSTRGVSKGPQGHPLRQLLPQRSGAHQPLTQGRKQEQPPVLTSRLHCCSKRGIVLPCQESTVAVPSRQMAGMAVAVRVPRPAS